MNIGFASAGRVMWRFRLLAGLLAAVGQIGWSSAALTLARDESSVVSHTEQSGIDLHHGHNEATCASCVALSFQATVKASPAPVSRVAIPAVVAAHRAENLPVGAQLLPNSCRAPPREA